MMKSKYNRSRCKPGSVSRLRFGSGSWYGFRSWFRSRFRLSVGSGKWGCWGCGDIGI